jgi:hypothetical protein
MSNKYHPVKLNLSEASVRRLAKGGRIRIPHSSIGSGQTYHATKNQITRLATAHAKGRGLILHMDDHQVRHNAKMGAGWFSNLFSKVKDFVKANGRAGLKAVNSYFNPNPLAKRAADVGIDYVADKIGLGKGMATFKTSTPASGRGGSFKLGVPTSRR